MKNIEKSKASPLRDETGSADGQAVGKPLSQNGRVSVTLFSLDKGRDRHTFLRR